MSRRFGKVNIEITNVCNLQCTFCPEVIRPKGVMAVDLFRRVIEQVAPVTEQVCFHLMGEPLLHPQLEALLAIAAAHRVRVFFVTNGVPLRERHYRPLLHPVLRQINFSLHAFQDNFGSTDPTAYLDRIFTYTELALRERPDLYLNYRLWDLKTVRPQMPEDDDWLRRIEERFQISIKRNPDVGAHKGRILKNRLYLHFDTVFTWPALDLPVLGERGTCYGLASHFGVLVDGTVVPCCLDKEGVMPLGNLQRQDLTDILQSDRAQAIRQGFDRRRLVEPLCQRCQYIERFSPEHRARERAKERSPATVSLPVG